MELCMELTFFMNRAIEKNSHTTYVLIALFTRMRSRGKVIAFGVGIHAVHRLGR